MFASVDEPTVTDLDDLCCHGVHVLVCDDDRCLDPGAPVEPAPAIDLDLGPGARLALQLQAAGAVPDLLTRGEVLDVVEATAILERWTAGLRIRMLAEFAERHPSDGRSATLDTDEHGPVPSQRWVPVEVGLTMGLTRLEALGEIAQAQRFVQVLPETLALLEQGRIDLRRAEAVARATAVLPDDLARRVEAIVLPKATDSTLRQMQDRIRRAIAKVDPEGEYRRHKEADRGRRVAPRSLEDGMASLWCYGSAVEIEAAWTMVDRLARSLPAEDPRTLDQRRFDLTVQLLTGRLTVTDLSDVDTAVDEVLATRVRAQGDSASDEGEVDEGEVDDGVNEATRAPGTDGTDAAHDHADPPHVTTEVGSIEADTTEAGTSVEARADTGSPEDPDIDSDHLDRLDGSATDRPTADPPPPTETVPDGPSTPGARPPTGHLVPRDVLADAVAEVLGRRPDLHATVRKPLVQVVVGVDTLLGSDRPAEVVGHGPIDADTARALAADAVIQRLLTDPMTGTVLEHGRTTYAPPAALADHVRSRDQVCRGPVCSRRVRDLDHHLDWTLGGDTDETNLFGYCKHCHLLKDVPGWHVLPHADGTVTWISPCGRRTTTEPFDYRDFTDDLPAWDGRPPSGAATDAPGSPPAVPAAIDAPGSSLARRPHGDVEDSDPPPF